MSMKVNKFMTIRALLALVIMASFSSCSKKTDSKGGSKATGWKINDKKGGFQYASKFKKQETAPGLVLVEGGTFTMGKVADDPMHDWNNTPTQQHVMSFYMDETEVTNLMYMEYLDWTKRVFPPEEENYKNIYEGASPDTLVWRNRLGYNETMTNNYLRHPAYAEYPVVGVNWVQATEFSKWRTDRVNESVLERQGYLKKDAKVTDAKAESTFSTDTYLAAPSKTFGGDDKIVLKGPRNSKAAGEGGTKGANGATNEPKNIYAQRTSGLILPEYRLPTEAEWEYACRGGRTNEIFCGGNNIDAVAWYFENSGRKTQPVARKNANGFGLYDMSGNVWEWTQDCWNNTYVGAPSNGTAWQTGSCSRRVFRGGSWDYDENSAKKALRIWFETAGRFDGFGLRVVRSLQ